MTRKTYQPSNTPMIDRRETVVLGCVRAPEVFAS